MLNITKCPGLSKLPSESLSYLPFLRSVNLHGNDLESLEEEAADWLRIDHIDVTANPFVCDCSMAWLDQMLREERPDLPKPKCLKPHGLVLGEKQEKR